MLCDVCDGKEICAGFSFEDIRVETKMLVDSGKKSAKKQQRRRQQQKNNSSNFNRWE